MTLPLLTADQYARMPWHARERRRASRIREVRAAAAEHAARYHAQDEGQLVDEKPVVKAPERIIEIDWLLEGGTSADEIARRLGVKPAALERQMARAGRHDLAARFAVLAHAARRAACPDCGAPMSYGSARCAACAPKLLRPARTCARQKLQSVLSFAEDELRAVARKAAWNRQAWGGADAYADVIGRCRANVAAAEIELARHETHCGRCQPMREAS